MSQSYDNTGTAALWSNEKYEAGGSHPRLKGSFYAHRDIKQGEQVDIALWDGNSEIHSQANRGPQEQEPLKKHLATTMECLLH